MIRTGRKSDGPAAADIYNHYIENTVVTFEEEAIDGGEMAERIEETLAAGLPWLALEQDGELAGYAYASKWKGRCAYRYAVEVTVYLHPDAVAKGLGSALYETLFSELEKAGMHVAMGGIALPNPASIALHEKFGMKKVAHFEQVGYKFDRWVDVGYWQKIIANAE